MQTVSIVINNYNYDAYLEKAIQSALEQTQAAQEIIVVDDGSTDRSKEILEAYAAQVTCLFQENQGQAAAINTGYAQSSGSILLFLDADDCLKRDAVESILQHWEPGLSKLHFPMDVIDSHGAQTDSIPRRGQLLPEGELLPELLESGNYTWMPMSGNAYARNTLEEIMPIPTDQFKLSADLYLSVRCARHGKIKALQRALSHYRAHDSNRYGSHRFFAPSLSALQARASSAEARYQLLLDELQQSGFASDSSLEAKYIPLVDWFDISMEHRIFGSHSLTQQSDEALKQLIKQRIDLVNQAQPNAFRKWAQSLIFQLLLHSPVFLLRLARQIGSAIEPALRKF